jgi:hypothetical protein
MVSEKLRIEFLKITSVVMVQAQCTIHLVCFRHSIRHSIGQPATNSELEVGLSRSAVRFDWNSCNAE